MRYAIISDVHANLEALRAVMAAISNEGADEIHCLGDVVGYYADPNACVELLAVGGVHTIAGNHDRVATGEDEPEDFGETARRAILWTREHLDAESRRFLTGLPIVHEIGDDFVMVHGAFHPAPDVALHLGSRSRVRRSIDALAFGSYAARLGLFGHTHRPVIHELRGGRLRTLGAGSCTLDPGAHYLINPGSVGQPRDGDPRASFLVLDTETRRVVHRRIGYDQGACDRKARSAGLLHRETLLHRVVHRAKVALETCADAISRRT